MRTKSLCLNPSLEKQPELLRCFHSVFGKDATRGNNSRKGMASARQEEGRCPVGGCLGASMQLSNQPPAHDGQAAGVAHSRPSDLSRMPTLAPPLGVGQFVLHRAHLQSQGDKTFVCNPGKRKGDGLRQLLGLGPHGGPQSSGAGRLRCPWKETLGCQD